MPDLFDPDQCGAVAVRNRIALAPMTRERCGIDGVCTELHAAYFAQRAGAGLVISGSNRVSPNGAGSATSAGLHDAAQVAGWRLVTEAVHAQGAAICAQIFHAGAAGHPETLPDSGYPVAPSAVSWGGPVYTARGKLDPLIPEPLDRAGIAAIADDFAAAARLAMDAGFDLVEVHACSGYLFEQFLSPRTNRRTDNYGGSVANRARALIETVEAVAGAIGAERTGLKLSPEFDRHETVVDDTPQETQSHIVRAVAAMGIGHLHVADNSRVTDYHALLRPLFPGSYIAGVGFTPAKARQFIAEGKADLISFGRLFISNPDLPERIRLGAKLNALDPATIYVASARGLLDYPTLEIEQG